MVICLALSFAQASEPNVWGKNKIKQIKSEIKRQSSEYMPAYQALRAFCDEEITKPGYSVMDKKMTPPSGNKHDYVSMGRYWWPDSTKRDGLPYIRRDGHSNPELKLLDRERLGSMAEAVERLSLMYYFSNEEKYARKAVELLRIWFLNEDTKMNPDMKFAQFVPGHNQNKGRAEGLLDTYSMVAMLSGVSYLKASEALTKEDLAGLKEWFGNYLDWMLTSEQGIAEGNTVNNHAVAYDVQVVAFAQFVGRDDVARKVIGEFLSRRIFTQVKEDGSQPKELARQTGFGYSVYNINHMLDMCALAGKGGKRMYRQASVGKNSIQGSIEYMSQYLGKPQSAFPYQQIKEWDGVQNSLAWILQRSTYFQPNTEYKQAFRRYQTGKDSDYQRLIYGY